MKQETFEEAQTLQSKIADYDNAIDKMLSPNPVSPPINLSFCFEIDTDALKEAVLKFLKNRRSKLQTEFNNLK